MPTILQKLRSGMAKANEYMQEHELAAFFGRLTTAGGFFIVLALVALGLWAVWVVPQWQVDHYLDPNHELTLPKQLELEDTYRKTVTQIVLGVFGLFLLYFTWRRSVASDKTVRIAEQGHITDRFTKAIEQLGKTDGTTPNIEVRLGAIYALERIALDSPRDHWTIMEVLTAYVRQNAPLDPDRPYTEGEKPRTDIQAILTVLGRRRTGPKRERPKHRLDLSYSRLCGAHCHNAEFSRANFGKSNLVAAFLGSSKLTEAHFAYANLERVGFYSANLECATMWKADLTRAEFFKAILRKANLSGAVLHKASLFNATLEDANLQSSDLAEAGFTGTDLKGANLWEAEVTQANLRDALNLNITQILVAKNWQAANYAAAFRAELGLPPECDEANAIQDSPVL